MQIKFVRDGMATTFRQIPTISGSRSGVFLLRKGCQTQIKGYAGALSRPAVQSDERLMRRNAGANRVVAASLCREQEHCQPHGDTAPWLQMPSKSFVAITDPLW